MPKGYAPALYVSSTCYDLSQVRTDLREFIESIGLDPVLSEHNSFPVNPDYDAVSNCLDIVKNRADILVLIVGGRYGSQTDTGKSVTNLEYLEAKAKGIPVYIFASKQILNMLPFWGKNKNADYSGVVDTPKLFDFIESLKNEINHWVFPFESAQDIIKTLRIQLAYLFMDALDLRARMQGNRLESEFHELGAKSLEILLTKPLGWKYKLFAQALKDKINSYERERFDLLYGVTYGKAIKIVSLEGWKNWLTTHLIEVANTTDLVARLVNEGLPVAFGEPGTAGDPKHIVYLATRIAEGYKKLIDWTLEFKNVETTEEYRRVTELGSHMTDNAIPEIENFAADLYDKINEALSNIGSNSEKKTIEFTVTLTVPDLTEFHREISRLQITSGGGESSPQTGE